MRISFKKSAVFMVICTPMLLAKAQIPVAVIADINSLKQHLEIIVQWSKQLESMRQHFGVMKQQYDMMKNEYEAMKGSYGRGDIGLSGSLQSSSVVPGSWQEVVEKQNSGAYGLSQKNTEDLIKTLPSDLFRNPEGQDATTYKLSTSAVRSAMSGGDILYAQVQINLNNLSAMARQVDSTTNIKDAADLQNRIATESGMLNSAMAKLSVMNINLQANLLNQQNQATAVNQQRYKRPQ